MTERESAHTLYSRIADELDAAVAALPEGIVAQRFYQAMLPNLRYVVAHENELRLMVISGMEGNSETIETGITNFPRMNAAFLALVSGASDMLMPGQVEQLATLLTNFHLLFMLFVLHDRTEGKTATFRLLAFSREAFTLIRPLLMIPPGAKALAKLSDILVSALIGGESETR
jgi:hypothetical protein